MTMPGDIPRLSAGEITATQAAHRPAPAFTIVPAHDEFGSNTIICSPPNAVPLRFGDNSFYPHLDAARGRGIEPLIIRQPGIGMDIDPVDLVTFPATDRTCDLRRDGGLEQENNRAPTPSRLLALRRLFVRRYPSGWDQEVFCAAPTSHFLDPIDAPVGMMVRVIEDNNLEASLCQAPSWFENSNAAKTDT
jgi:Guanylyl transferase CofC like